MGPPLRTEISRVGRIGNDRRRGKEGIIPSFLLFLYVNVVGHFPMWREKAMA